MRVIIPVERDAAASVRGFLRRLLEAKIVDALLAPVETPAGTITPALIVDPGLVDAADPLAPVMGLNAASLAGKVSIREPRARIGVVLRPCELRALVELVKLKQANLDDLVTIGVDCFGTYDVPHYLAKARKAKSRRARARLWQTLAQETLDDPQAVNAALRDACQMCERPHVEQADITLELLGADLAASIPITLPDEMAEKLNLSPADAGGNRDETIERVVAARARVRDARFSEMRQQLEQEGIEGVMGACVRCHNCMTVCPICYCKTCLFQSAALDHEPMRYATWARRKGIDRLPADTMLFHLTRLNHMVLSCVGCGMCTSACPAELPVGRLFRTIGQQVQDALEYAPGRSIEDALPLVTFQEAIETEKR